MRTVLGTCALALAIALAGCTSDSMPESSPSDVGGEASQEPTSPTATPESKCPDGLLEAVRDRVALSLGSTDVAIGELSDLEPDSIRPLLADACIIAYTSPAGSSFTYNFSQSASLEEIGDAARSAGYTGENNLDGVFSQYRKDLATVTTQSASIDAVFSQFFPSGVIVQTAIPVGG